VLERCSGVGFGIGFEGASSGSAVLVAFWLFSVFNFGWSGIRSRFLWCRNLAWKDSEIFGPCVETLGTCVPVVG
jgi:hypothetical protein